LLTNQAEQAEEILQNYQPQMSKETYLQFMESIH